jgi:hypothetical protein
MNRDKLIKEIIEAGYPEQWTNEAMTHKVRIKVPNNSEYIRCNGELGIIVQFVEPNSDPCVFGILFEYHNCNDVAWFMDDEFVVERDKPIRKGRCKAIMEYYDSYKRCIHPRDHGDRHDTIYDPSCEGTLSWTQTPDQIYTMRRRTHNDKLYLAASNATFTGKQTKKEKYRRWRDISDPVLVPYYHEQDKTDDKIYAKAIKNT